MSKQYRNICFTKNNPDGEGEEAAQAFITYARAEIPTLAYITFQLEEGENGTPHYQGYAELSKNTAHGTVHHGLQRAHLEARKGSQEQAIAYANKEDTRVAGPWSWGEAKRQGKRTDLKDATDALRDGGMLAVRDNHPEQYVKFGNGLSRLHLSLNKYTRRAQPRVELLFGPAGVGKSRSVWDAEPQLVSIPNLNWFDGYEGEQAVLFDDFDGSRSECPLKHLLNCLDRYPLRIAVKGAHTLAQWIRVYITTNIHPRAWYDWSGREEQFPALERRFSKVTWWKSESAQPVVVTPGSDDWVRFWAGPPAVVPRQLNRFEDWAEVQQADKFNF